MRKLLIGLLACWLIGCLPPTLPPPSQAPQPKKRYYVPILVGRNYQITQSQKKGLAMAHPRCEDLGAVGATWNLGWGIRPLECAYIFSAPMIWSPEKFRSIAQSQEQVLLGFNECDLGSQCNTSPEDAARAWHDLIEPNFDDWFLVSPAPSHLNPEWLLKWYRAYVESYGRTPRVDALAMHCYLRYARECIALAERYMSWAKVWEVEGGVWVTEFAFSPCEDMTYGEVMGELAAFVRWMEEEPMIARYAYFTNRMQGNEPWASYCSAPLVYPGGNLTEIGLMYAALPAERN